MANVFSLFGEIGVDTSKLERGLGSAEKSLKDAERGFNSTSRGAENLGTTLDETGRSAGGFSSKLDQMGGALVGAGAALTAGLTVPLTALGAMATSASLDMEKLRAGLTAVMGSADAASAEFVKLREVAKLPGLGLKEAVQGSVNLQAAGLSADLARRALQSFGNALATVGKGKNELDGVILALTQIQGKGKVAAQEINQIAERVPQIRNILKGAFGTADTEQLQKMGMSTEQFIGKVITELEKLPPVATTASGQLENLGDTIDQALLPLGNRITALIAPAVAMLEPIIAGLGSAFDKLATPIQYVVLAVGAFLAALGPILVAAGGLAFSITSITTLMTTLGITTVAALAPVLLIVGKVILIVAALAAVAYVAYKAYETNFAGIKDIVDSTVGFIIDLYESLKATLLPIVESTLGEIQAFWTKHGGEIISAVEFLIKMVLKPMRDFLQVLLYLWQNYGDKILSAIGGIANLIIQTFKMFLNIIQGNWRDAFNNLVNILSSVGSAIWDVMKAIGSGLLSILSGLARKALEYGKLFINEFVRGMVSTGMIGLGVAKGLGAVITQGATDLSSSLNSIALPALTSFNSALAKTGDTAKETASGVTDVANAVAGKGGAKGGGKSLKQASDEAAEAIARTRMELLLYGKETRLAKFDTELAAGAMSKWTDAQILFQRWQLFTLDLLDRSAKAIRDNKKAMDDLIKSLEKAAQTDMAPIGKGIKDILPKAPEGGGPGIGGRITRDGGDIDTEFGPPPIAPWDTYFGKIRDGLRKLKEELPSFTDAMANITVGFVNAFGDAFANAVNNWDGTLKGFLNSVASTFRSFVKQVIAELMRMVAIRAATKLFESIGLFGIGAPKGPQLPFVPGVMMASGGLIKGPGSGMSDSIPTMLSNGEYVIPAKAVRAFGVGFFDQIRNMQMPVGAMATPSPASVSNSSSVSTTNNSFTINVPAGSGGQKTGAMVQRDILTALRKTERRNR